MRIFTVSRQRSWFLYLLVAISLLLGMVGPAQVMAAPRLAPQDGGVTLDSTVGSTPTVDSTYTTGTANNTNSITFSHTTGSGNNRLLLVGISFYNATTARTVSSVTFGGTALTSVGTSYQGNTRRVAIYRLIAPSASTTANVVVTFRVLCMLLPAPSLLRGSINASRSARSWAPQGPAPPQAYPRSPSPAIWCSRRLSPAAP